MESIFILYMPGHAGNFLTRLFSLGPDTVPQVPIAILKESVIDTGQVPTIDNRAEYYSFKTNNQHCSWQEFHRAWPDFYQQELFEYFNELYHPPFPYVVYSIHPYEFILHESDITKQRCDFYYVDLDPKYNQWVSDQRLKLNFTYRPNYDGELATFNQIKTKYQMKKISLTNMINSTDSFVNEYLKIIKEMSLTPKLDNAVQLYHEWIAIRGPQ
jgi:hypothetical protein